jgi:hypothetical protein
LGGDNIGHFERKVLTKSADLTLLDYCLWGWMMREVYQTKVDKPDELLARILDDAACIKKREDQLRRTTRDLRTGIAKCTEVDGENFRICIVNCKKSCQFCLINLSLKR